MQQIDLLVPLIFNTNSVDVVLVTSKVSLKLVPIKLLFIVLPLYDQVASFPVKAQFKE